MTQTVTRDKVLEVGDLWYCVVDGVTYGGWVSRALAVAGMEVEQRRAEKRYIHRVPWTPSAA